MTAGRLRSSLRLVSAPMLGVASGAILVPLNTTMLAVALPDVMGTFGLGAAEASSLVTLYLGAVAVTLPLGGALGDRFGHRRTFLVGVLGFASASAAASIAGSFEVLQAARVAQASSGALISTSSAALIREMAPPDRQGEAFGLFDLITSVSPAVGPFLGGLLVASMGWRSLFVVAVPLGLGAATFVGLGIHRRWPSAPQPSQRPPPIDIRGLVLLASLIVAFLVALRAGATPAGLAAAVAFIPLLIAFLLVELRHERPAVDPRLLTRRPFAAAVLGVFGATIVLHGTFLVIPLLVEIVLAQSPATSGAVLLGVAAVSALVAPFGGRLSDRRGRRAIAVSGGLVTALGVAGLSTPAGAGSVAMIAVLLGVVGLGFGLAGPPRQAAAFESIERSRLGMAAGTFYTGRYLGGVVGASAAGAIVGSTVTAERVELTFAVLAVAAIGVAVASLGLRAAPAGGRPAAVADHPPTAA